MIETGFLSDKQIVRSLLGTKPMRGGSEMPKEKGSPHYFVGGVEVLEVMRAKMTRAQYEGFLLGNVIKYALRYNWAGESVRDMEKCLHYCELLLKWQKEVFPQ